MRQYSHCTSEPGCVTDEECELAAELTADFASMCGVEHREHAQQQEGQPPQPLGAQDAAYPNRGASLASTASMCSCGAAGGGEAPPLSLYEQLGGGVAVKQVVDGFYDRVLAAAEVKRFFQGVDMSKLRRKFLLFATYALGGPDEYLQLHPEPWPQLYAAHKRLIDSSGECGSRGLSHSGTAHVNGWLLRQRRRTLRCCLRASRQPQPQPTVRAAFSPPLLGCRPQGEPL